MTVPPAVHRSAPLRLRSSVAGVLLASAVAAAAATFVMLRHPVALILAFLVLAVVAAMMLRVEWALLTYVAIEPFGDLLKDVSSVSVKGVGALLFASWLLRLLIRTRPVSVKHPAIGAAAALVLTLMAAIAVHPNGAVGVEVLTRYLSFLAVLVVLVDCIRTGLPARRVVTVFVVSCALAAVVGLIAFLVNDGGRAAGPMRDANDFAFFLVTAIPFAFMLGRIPSRFQRLYPLALVVLVVATLATFSRGALVALAAMGIYALVTRQLRGRDVAVVGGLIALVTAVVVVMAPQMIERSLEAKQHVADGNVSARFVTWTIAAEMTAGHPVLGLGPAGFRTNADDYIEAEPIQASHYDVAHQMFLEVSSELGLIGLAAFLALLGFGFAGAHRAARATGPPGLLGRAVCTSFVGVLACSAFLSEQYYLPVWLLVALGAAVDPASRFVQPRRSSCVSSS